MVKIPQILNEKLALSLQAALQTINQDFRKFLLYNIQINKRNYGSRLVVSVETRHRTSATVKHRPALQ